GSPCPETDQRGEPRTSPCDVGAVEFTGVLNASPLAAPVLVSHTFACSDTGSTVIQNLDLQSGDKLQAVCPTDCSTSSETVYGTNIYGVDSSICRAALHNSIGTGVIFQLEILGAEMQDVYADFSVFSQGSSQNDIQSQEIDGYVDFTTRWFRMSPLEAATATISITSTPLPTPTLAPTAIGVLPLPESARLSVAGSWYETSPANPGTLFFNYPAGWAASAVSDSAYATLINNSGMTVMLAYDYLSGYTELDLSQAAFQLTRSLSVSEQGYDQEAYFTLERNEQEINAYSRPVILATGEKRYYLIAAIPTPDIFVDEIAVLIAEGDYEPYIETLQGIVSTIAFDLTGDEAFTSLETPNDLRPEFQWQPDGDANLRQHDEADRFTLWIDKNSASDPRLCYPASGDMDVRVGLISLDDTGPIFFLEGDGKRIGLVWDTATLRVLRTEQGNAFPSTAQVDFRGGYVRIVRQGQQIGLYYSGSGTDWLPVGDFIQLDFTPSLVCMGGNGGFTNLRVISSTSTAAVNPLATSQPVDPTQPFMLDASVLWLDTGLDLSAGQLFNITASGETRLCRYDDADCQAWDANGWTAFDCEFLLIGSCPMPSAPPNALIGRVGKDGVPFLVGTGGDFGASESGRLYLTVNDHPDQYSDNDGQLQITISTSADTVPPTE
ncbi:MAG: hypothetical protein K8I82_09260, partial [Anaerolineae bacterium]|nr:hypothetical protein [Anaerolineae bacterium]